MQSEGVRKNQSIIKALAIMEDLAEQQKPQRLLDLANRLGMPSSTVLRFLNTLIDYEYVQQDPETSRYSLTLKLTRLGHQAHARFSYMNNLKPYLQSINLRLEEAVSLSIEKDMNVVYIDTIEGPDHILQTLQRIGKVAPMHSTGAGKVLMMNYDKEKILQYIAKKGLPSFTDHTLQSPERLLEEIEWVRDNGFAFDNEECEIGVKCVAFPIRDFSSHVVAAISISAPITRFTDIREQYMISVLREETEKASRYLGWEG